MAFGPPLVGSIVPPEVTAAGAAFGAAHLFAGEPLAAQTGPSGVARPFWPSGTPGKGLRLASYAWPAPGGGDGAKGVILFVHGHGSYQMHEVLSIEAAGAPPRYPASWAAAWAAAGFSVAGLDNRGCGLSDGPRGLRCFVERFEDYVDDVISFAKAIQTQGGPGFAGLPVFVVGVSLGGCIAVHAAERDPSLFRGVILLAPMLSIDAMAKRGVNRLLVAVAGALSALVPTLPVARMPGNNLHPELQCLWDEDPLCAHFPTRARNAVEYLRATQALGKRLASVTFPFLAFHGDEDTLTELAGTVALGEQAASADKAVHVRKGRWHVLTREPGNEEIRSMIVDWCAARLA